MRDLTIRELQEQLPWGDGYSKAFKANLVLQRDFAHALLHIHKSAGKLAAEVEEADHNAEALFDSDVVGKMLADLVICTMRMANTSPTGAVDLQRAVEDRLESKNPDFKLKR